MRNEITAIALNVLVILSLSQDAFAADSSTSDEPVVIEKVGERRFRLINNSAEPLVYMQFLNKEKNPVPYCKDANDSISICSREPPVVRDGKPALEEAKLKPGKSVTFDVTKGNAVMVGVRLLIDGEQQLLWYEL
jgi:uncharacterized cupredoxin-like copper-binding protein